MNSVEKIIADALTTSRISFVTENDMMNAANLDFYLPRYDVYIEVKSFHSDRIAEQMKRARNVIVIQGEAAAQFFAEMLNSYLISEK